ncbi:integrase [Caballeronia sordidicola]|nr:integrase [Caballeronia sordidicola]
MNMLAGKVTRRKSMAGPTCAVGMPSENWAVNREKLVSRARAVIPFPGVEWDSAVWDVTRAYEHRTRGYKADKPAQRLLFTHHSQISRSLGAPLSGPFSDVVKALVCLRHCQRGQSSSSHMVFVRAVRYVVEAMADRAHDIGELTADHLDAAAALLFARERETSAYKVVGHMEEHADMVDRNGLCRLRLDWRYRRKIRPRFPSDDRCLEDGETSGHRSRLPDEQAIRAIGALYQSVAHNAAPTDPVSADRIMVLIATVMVCTGLRVGEMLTLPERPISLAEDGSKILRYAQLKGRADDVAVSWAHKPLLTETAALVEEAMEELHEATEGARIVARQYASTGALLANVPSEVDLDSAALPAMIGLRSKAVAQFLRARKITYRIVDGRIRFSRADLLKGLELDHWTLPVIPGAFGPGLALHEALCVVYANQMHRGTRTTLMYAARPITDQNVSDFLGARHACPSIFERRGIICDDGTPIAIRSHGFRHFLNHMLDEGGAPDLVQTKWFGRKHAADTGAYQHSSPAERAAHVASEIMGGRMKGAVPDIAGALPVNRARTFLFARIHAVHDVGPGMCLHDFQMSPCPRHLQCADNCDDYIWLKHDESRLDELKRQAAVVFVSLRNVQEQIDVKALVEPDWIRHLCTRYDQLMVQLAMLDFVEADLVRYMDRRGHDDESDPC